MVVSSRLRLATGRVAGVEHGEAAGAVGRLQHPGLEAGLADGRRLLVAGDAEDRHRAAEQVGARLAEVGGRVADRRQHRHRHVEERADVRVPAAGADVVEQRARGVGGVGGVRAAAGQLPDQPGVDGPEQQLAPRRPLAGAGVGVEQPLELGAREVGVEQQAGALGDHRLVPGGAQLGAERAGAAVLPDDRPPERLAGRPVPDQRGLALVGDADRRDRAGSEPRPLDRGAADRGGRGPEVGGVVLDPARLREMLRELLLGGADHRHPLVEDDGPARGRALVDGQDVGHRASPCRSLPRC